MGLGIRGWRRLGLGVGMGGFRDQGVETGRFRGGDGWVLLVGMGGFRDQGVETGRFRGGDGWV